jgi:two-component system, sensor histidine kinase and response regulator
MQFLTDSPSPESSPPARRDWLLPAIAIVLVTSLLVLWNLYYDFGLRREQAAARVQSVGALRVNQVDSWVKRQMGLADFLVDSSFLGDLFLRWQDNRDVAAGDLLRQRIIKFRQSNDADSAFIVDAEGNTLAGEHAPDERVSPELAAAVKAAAAGRKPVHTTIYRVDKSPMPLRMDVVIPLLTTGTPLRGAVIVRIDPRRTLYTLLSEWPVPSLTGESMLWQEIDGQLVALSESRWQSGSARRLVRSFAPSGPLAEPSERAELAPQQTLLSVDYRGARVLAAVLRVPDTDWWVVSKIDLYEVDGATWTQAGWSLVALALALSGIGLAVRLWKQRLVFDQAKRERHEQRERLKTLGLLEAIALSTSELIFAKDLQSRFIFYNRAAGQMFNKAPDEMLGRTNEDLFGKEIAARMAPNDQLVLKTLQPMVFEETVPTPRGDRTFEYTKGPLYDGRGKLIGLFNVARDVTESRRAEMALRDSNAHNQSVISVLSEGIVVCDPKGIVTSCNLAAEKILGVQASVWQGLPIAPEGWHPLHPDGSPMPVEQTPPALVLAGAEAQRDVLLIMKGPTGATIFFNVSSAPVRSADSNELLAVVTSFVDVTQKRQMEADLERNRQELEMRVAERTQALQIANEALEDAARFNLTIAYSIPGRVAYWDTTRRCRFANRAYADWFGYTPEAMLGMTESELFGESYARIRPPLDAAMRGEPQTFERETLHEDGLSKFQQVHLVPERDAAGNMRGVLVMSFDITALKTTEQALKTTNEELKVARDKAEMASRAKSAFLANMSHEIRTPMNAVIGMAHLLARDATDARQRDRLAKIDTAAQHLLGIIDDILDLSKIESGMLRLEDSEFSLHSMLRSTFEMLRAGATRKGLELLADIEPLPDRVRGDATRLSQMLINLLSNAIKFTEKGWVRLRVHIEKEETPRLKLRFEVQDTGIGIPLDRQSAVFKSFEQADSSTTRRYGGTGLGLALTRQFALAMGGQAGVQSRPGEGSTFWVTAWIALADVGNAARAPVQVNAPELAIPNFEQRQSDLDESLEVLKRLHAGKRILLAEDNPVNQEVARELLHLAGLEVETAETGTQAIALAQASSHGLILMDMQMPDKDGLEAARAIRAAGGTMPIIAMTANALVEDREACLAAGMNDHLAKPVNPSALYDILVRWMAKASAG